MGCPQASADSCGRNGRPFVIPVFIPHAGCPHQCVFCNQRSITGTKPELPSAEDLSGLIKTFLEYKKDNRTEVQVAFYGGNFLGLDAADIRRLLEQTRRFVEDGRVDSIRFSTRPDTIDRSRLDILRAFPVKTVELGIQSMDDRVLAAAGRGHTASDTCLAAALLQQYGYQLGAQMMVGLPGDTPLKAMATARRIARLSPAFVRIYPTVVLAGSGLARRYQNGAYQPLSLETCVSLVKDLFLVFQERGIPVIRMGLQASRELDDGAAVLAGPYHPAFGHLVLAALFLDRAAELIAEQGRDGGAVTLAVHPRNISRMRGLKNRNIEILKNRYRLAAIDVCPDLNLGPYEVALAATA